MRACALLVLAGMTASGLHAQQPSASRLYVGETQIRTTATATQFVSPDLAVAHFEISARDSTLREAARRTAVIAEAVRSAVVKAGVPKDSVLGRGSVAYLWDQATQIDVKPNAEFKRYDTTYVFRDAVVVRIRDLKRVGAILDAALDAGAQKLVSLQFSSARVQQAGQDALVEATRQARKNAELMAEAAGGKVGRPLELTTEKSVSDSFYDLRSINASAISNAHNPGLRPKPPDAEVRVSVYGRWELLAADGSTRR
jgi:uncharacterized protein